MSAATLQQVLAATGYLPDGQPAVGLLLGEEAWKSRHRRSFFPDALWRSPSSLTIYFKYEHTTPTDEQVSQWRREIWNEGFSPLLWVISPERIDLYNGFGAPVKEGDAQKYRIRFFNNVETALSELDALAGRLSIETGQFWAQVPTIDRKTSVDQKLLSQLAFLEHDLVAANLDRNLAQALIGRVIFTQYLIDREIIGSTRLMELCGHTLLPAILRDPTATEQLFTWLCQTFNGDMFPSSVGANTPDIRHLARVVDFLEAVDPESGQQNIFPYQFDVIPVELISSIYEQFAHAEPRIDARHSNEARTNGVHYTRLSLVSLVLDEVMDGVTGEESVLDLTCGSGVFLVEALRRLVYRRAGCQPLTRKLIRSILYEQIYGIDISEAAVRVAAFSLYLAALELDPDPQPAHELKFQPLIGKTLLIGDARTIEQSDSGKAVLATPTGLKQFDIIVGNPPWSFRGKSGTETRRMKRSTGAPMQPRGEGLDFVLRAVEFSHEKTRFGIVLPALPFFSRSGTGLAAALHVIKLLAPVTLVNLSNLRDWLFATATMPAVVLLARHRPQRPDQVTVVQIPWTASGAKTQSFEVSSSDIINIPLPELEARPIKLKAAAVGYRRDLMLLEMVTENYCPLETRLRELNTDLNVGLTRGNEAKETPELSGLEVLEAADLRHFVIPDDLPLWGVSKAERPRSRDIYRSPLLVVKETFNKVPRVIAAVAERDLVFTNALFGASFVDIDSPRESAHLVAAILSSSFAAWFFLMSSSELGVKKMRLTRHDVALLPMPYLAEAIKSEAGKRLLKIEGTFRKCELSERDWAALDEAVCDLYELDSSDRVVISDGLYRATWQWQTGRENSIASASANTDIVRYAEVFLSVIGGWLSARNKRHMRAEIFDLPKNSALRVVRFVLEDGPGKAKVEVLQPDGGLNDILTRIGKRLKVKLASALSGERELRIHGRNEVVIIKPAARRYWMGVAALEDADAVVVESFTGGNA